MIFVFTSLRGLNTNLQRYHLPDSRQLKALRQGNQDLRLDSI